ncbi:MAG TPA: C4-dicarboxylate ABC transporter permease, partial [Candidatus Aminicenantes bacterium]|nr:C4-dicarboxylate ABC transporter permease [Candidatus Aminicenantes bacterium]
MFQNLLEGLHLMLTLGNLLAVIAGVSFGVFMGSVPGLTATMGIALIIPMTYSLDPITAFAILLGAYKGGLFGGSIPAIL